ncbi:MAG: hypothetical protein VX248_10760 [Pseudomonadota bacterium]|nr:hypothetical protein [Pseudomonadota bacterium]
MKILFPLLLAAAFVSACGGPQLTPEQKAKRAESRAIVKAAQATAKTVTVNDKTFSVARVVKYNHTIVELVGEPTPYYIKDVEAASRAATGCKGKFDAGVLAFVGWDIQTIDLAFLRTKISGDFDGWTVDLDC